MEIGSSGTFSRNQVSVKKAISESMLLTVYAISSIFGANLK
jgi:hypothetical protein